MDSAEVLQRESSLAPGTVDAADNVHLERIFRELEEHHIQRFGRAPKLFRRAGETLEIDAGGAAGTATGRPGQRGGPLGRGARSKNVNNNAAAAAGRGYGSVAGKTSASTSERAGSRAKTPVSQRGAAPDLSVSGDGGARRRGAGVAADVSGPRPPPAASTLDLGAGDLNDLAEVIRRDIHWGNPNVPWESVAGLDDAKRLLKEAVVMPIRYPELFRGLLAPWRGVLLYGPPGTGKTMLAKAVATECDTTFFNVSSSTVVSKWRGDSEKLVRVLFELARHHAPSTIFMDELDAVMSSRDGGGVHSGGGDHESSRRLKTELLVQLDGLNRDEGELVFLLAATNLPWELDPAMLRRLEKRILVGLPSEAARARMMERYLAPHAVAADVSLRDLAAGTDGYSGADVMLLCKESAMRPLRRLMDRLMTSEDSDEPSIVASTDDDGAEVSVGEITRDDVAGALAATRPTQTDAHARRYEEWTRSFGAVL